MMLSVPKRAAIATMIGLVLAAIPAAHEQAVPLQGVPPVADVATFTPLATRIDPFVAKPRVVVLTDIANEPDDQMSFVRLLVSSNQFDIAMPNSAGVAHVILAVTDNGVPALTSYRRVILTIKAAIP